MDKEKEIEEMASIIYSKLNTGTYDNAFDDVGDAVAALQEAGYRKADEVHKETAKEIWNNFKLQRNHFDDWGWEVVKLICRTNGVEVDE